MRFYKYIFPFLAGLSLGGMIRNILDNNGEAAFWAGATMLAIIIAWLWYWTATR